MGVGIDSGSRAIVAYGRNGRLAVRVIHVKTGWTSAEATVAPPAGQRRPVEIVVGTGEPGIAVVAWRSYPVTEGPTGHVDAAAAIMPTGSNRPRPAISLGEGDTVAYPRGPIARPWTPTAVPSSPGRCRPGPASRADDRQADQAGTCGAPQACWTRPARSAR